MLHNTKLPQWLNGVVIRSTQDRASVSFGHVVGICIGNRMNASAFRDLWARVMF